MRRFFLIVLGVIFAVGVYAQHEKGELTVQPRVGVNFATFTGAVDCDSRIGLALGADFEYQATRRFSLSVGLTYSQQGVKKTIDFEGARKKVAFHTDYINIPVLANVYVADGLVLKFGVQPGFNVKANYVVASQDVEVSGNLSDYYIFIRTFDFAFPMGVSYEFKNVVLDCRYNVGVIKVIDGGDDSKNGVLQLTLGYKFSL